MIHVTSLRMSCYRGPRSSTFSRFHFFISCMFFSSSHCWRSGFILSHLWHGPFLLR